MFSYKSKQHYEKVLGPSKLFSSPDQDSNEHDSESEYQTTDQTSCMLPFSHRAADQQMTPVKEMHHVLESRNSQYSQQKQLITSAHHTETPHQPPTTLPQHYKSYQLPPTNHPITMVSAGVSPMPLSPNPNPRTDQNMSNLMNSAGIQVTIDRNSSTSRPTSKLKQFANLAQCIKNDDEMTISTSEKKE